MQPTYSTQDLARLIQSEHEQAVRAAHRAHLEDDRPSFLERTTSAFHQTRLVASAGLAAAALVAALVATIH